MENKVLPPKGWIAVTATRRAGHDGFIAFVDVAKSQQPFQCTSFEDCSQTNQVVIAVKPFDSAENGVVDRESEMSVLRRSLAPSR